MRNILFFIVIVSLSACNNHREPVQTYTPVAYQQAKAPTGARYFFNPPHGQPGHTCALAVGAPLPAPQQVQPAPTPQTQVQPAQSAAVQPQVVVNPNDKRPNPKHGEPGHRCDIAVGMPLNTPTGSSANAVAVNKPVVPVYNPNDTRPNPKHGEPDHRCDIAVGQPLNSNPPQNFQADTTAIKGTPAKNGA